MINYYHEIGWVFICVCIFGLSEYFVKTFCKSTYLCLLYYLAIGLIGLVIVRNNYEANAENNTRNHRNKSVITLNNFSEE